MTPSVERLAPGPRGHFLLGGLLEVRRDRLGFLTGIMREFGDVVRFTMGPRVLHLVTRTDGIRHVLHDNYLNYRKGVGLSEAKRWLGEGLLTTEGDVWSRQRRLMQPAFQRQRLTPFDSAVTSATARMLDGWSRHAARGEPIDVALELSRLTLGIIARVLFSVDVTHSGKMDEVFKIVLHEAMDQMMSLVPLPEWLPLPSLLRFKRAVRTLDEFVSGIIREHRQGSRTDRNLISMLMSERENRDDGFGDRELRDQVVTMLFAGHETTAASLGWTLYLMDRHPEAWLRVRAEVDRVLAGRVPTHEDMARLPWTRMVYDECLRLYPPVWLIPRRAIAADQVGGYHIPAESDMLVSPYVIHRRPDYWPDPEAFNPERFSAEETARRPRYTYLPFGAGPRACIGATLATMEALLVLVMIAQQKYRLRLVPGHPVVPEPLLTLRFRHGLAMFLVRADAD